MAHFEKTLDSDTRFEGRVFTLTVDTVELENGRTSTREVVHHNGGACIAALTENDEVYLVRQFRYAFGQELWELPAGKLEKGEDPFEAAKRELGEECGLTAEHFVDLGPVYPTVGYCTEIIYCWAATGLTPCDMHLDEDEFLPGKGALRPGRGDGAVRRDSGQQDRHRPAEDQGPAGRGPDVRFRLFHCKQNRRFGKPETAVLFRFHIMACPCM